MIQSSLKSRLLLTFRPHNLVMMMTAAKLVHHHEKRTVGQFSSRLRGSGGAVPQIARSSSILKVHCMVAQRP